MLVNAVPTAVTDAERSAPQLKIDSKGLGWNNIEIPLNMLGIYDADALSNQGIVSTTFLPLNLPTNKRSHDGIFNKEAKFQLKQLDDITAGWDVAVGLVHSSVQFDSPEFAFLRSLFASRVAFPPFSDSFTSKDTGKAHGTAAAEVPLSTITVDAGYNQVAGHAVYMNSVGVDAAEPISGVYSMESGDIDDHGPQLWPLPFFQLPALGTVTERVPSSWGVYGIYPAMFSVNPNANLTFKPKSTALVVQSTAPDLISNVLMDF